MVYSFNQIFGAVTIFHVLQIVQFPSFGVFDNRFYPIDCVPICHIFACKAVSRIVQELILLVNLFIDIVLGDELFSFYVWKQMLF